jgi:predicted phage tail protein
MKLTTVRLYGRLGAMFGRVHRLALDTGSAREAVFALNVLFPRLAEYLTSAKDTGWAFAVFVDRDNVGESDLGRRADNEIRIAPVLMGSKSGGVFQIVLGVALLAVSYFFPPAAPFLAPLGYSMILGGIVQLLTPQPKGLGSSDSAANTPSYSFNGPINTEAQGHNVPLLYGGPIQVGSAVISAGIDAEDQDFTPTAAPTSSGFMGGGGGYNTISIRSQ